MPFPASHPALDRALSERGYAEPTPVQAAVLEAALSEDGSVDAESGRDLLVSAQTGSGKTVAFGLALAPTLLGEAERFTDFGAPLALVIAPTRELAQQVASELTWLYAQTGARIVSCVGGMDPKVERRALERGAHIVVGTPGRLRDHLERGALDLSEARAVVLDEADEMLDMGFQEDLTFILDAAPPTRRTLMFSATLARDIVQLAKTYQRDAIRIDTVAGNKSHADIEYKAIRCAPNEIELAVVNVLRYFEAPGALVFANTRERVKHLTASLRERGFSVVGLSGELTQSARSEALQALRDGHARVCVATDVAARGLDLPDLGLVIHAEIPVNKAGLLHRSGRTGRAGKKGVSVLLVSYTRRRKVELMLQSAAIVAEWSGPPSAEMILEKDRERLLADPALTAPVEDAEALELGRLLLERTTPEQVAASLIRLYRQKLPAPEDVYDDDRMKRQQETGKNDRGQTDAPFQDFARGGEMAWFRINIGRDKNADPKWLLPTICRIGHVTKRDIGSIKIFDRETKFEITKEAKAKFKAAVAASTEDGVTVQDAVAPGPKERPASRWDKTPVGGERPERAERKPWANKTEGDRAPRGDKPPFEKKPWVKREGAPTGEKKPWVKRDNPEAVERTPWAGKVETGDAPAKKPWVKRTADAPTPEGKKPWVKRDDPDRPKTPWTPASDATPSAPGEKPWKGKPKGGDRPWAAKDARGKPAAKPAGDKKPFKNKKKPNG
ncbi:DEAD/DEAH box helicase [Brevundimonas subvibrioides]|uniref:DEAD/DEAH box helicase domain protein n=1 Tax=Brevundimonas subvibrioides (strain ATCC 15264 / DSM 4735 / LMG 14903 / NBRC 16000 / CB 81) TaxID=633149 RepID=D9QGQ2_BRESC|nr:DEAD/DEAH box helicase [Brevundimonas subvibrioides]ADL00868.1 DEAD/DEAH box helicase domain protein [Brevundimonas subvibrioides ATCC 15264]